MQITDLKCNYQRNPIGISLEHPVFTWNVTDGKGERITCTEFELAEDPAFGRIVHTEKGKALQSPYTPQVELQPGKTYYWKIKAADDCGDAGESPVATLEGGHSESSFRGQWITSPFDQEVHPVFRKHFTLNASNLQEDTVSRLYICGLGLYEAYLNGRRIGDQYLTPYFTDYRYWIQYQTYDVRSLLKEGENTLEVLLGNGWYKGRFGYMDGGQLREYYGQEFLLLADLHIRTGAADIWIVTDESWECAPSPVLLSGIYDGEVWCDPLSEEIGCETQTGENSCEAASGAGGDRGRDLQTAVRATGLPKGTLSPMVGLPVKGHETLKPVEILRTPAGELVLDFGQEITGWASFTDHMPAGHKVHLYYGEVLQQGNFYRDNLRSADAEFSYISAGKEKEVRPRFTFYGFRYVKVLGLSEEEIQAADFEAVALYSDLEETGQITTSHEKLARLIENTKWSQKDNFLDIPTDCPQRDERCGWTGDAQIFSGAASYHMETPSFFRKYLADMCYEQKDLGGAVPFVVPDILSIGREKKGEPPFDMSKDQWGEAGSCAWGDAAVFIPWNLYLHYGNKSWLSEEYANMKAWCDFMIHMEETHCGSRRLWDCGFHFGDWLALDVEGDTTGMENLRGGTDVYFVSSCYYMQSLKLTAGAAALLGKQEDADFYSKRSTEVREAIRAKYRTTNGCLSIDTQTAYALAIWFDLFDPEEMEVAGWELMRLLGKWNHHLSTGFVGTAYLCQALTKTGHTEEAFTLLLNEDYPSWLYEVNMGATTIWERWNSMLPDGTVSGTGMNSFNHYAYGAIVEWIYTTVCGICVDEEHITGRCLRIAPHTDERIGDMRACVDLTAGRYESGWKRKGKQVTFTFTVPYNGQATFVPDAPLADLSLNGQAISEEELRSRIFTKGTYEICGKYRK
ncbi:MAG: glycoside hydrolase family 78 protein [Lachnospiraceae bacterium]|nr:glycoside hydrolase family 78 protein [Lachnospiraceae bacterium]